jgi:DNA-binding helix-hairpin-helix protein with protein kinase domain
VQLRRASNQASIVLGKELGRGGEGAVFPVIGAPDLVAKIYRKPPTTLKGEKLRSMARRASPALLRVAAWPVDVLTDEAGTVRGFLMPKVSAREDVHELYSPKSRRRSFPNVDFRFVVRVATNIARAFAQVHAVGNVIGDVNHGNALVGRDGTVVLIDCDSFQVRDGARIFTCDVGVPLFTPPELTGQPFRGLKRTAGHDAFGLAVLLFHLLYIGRHPFAGKHVAGEMPIERAIAESRFVYGSNAAHFGMTPPPGTLNLRAFGEEIALLFELAFAPPSETPRPNAAQWVEALQKLERSLGVCAASAAHHHPPDAGGCCWCEHEKLTGMRAFGKALAEAVNLGGARIARLWDAITSIRKPEAAQPLETPPGDEAETAASDPMGPVPRALLGAILVGLGVVSMFAQPLGTPLFALFYFACAGQVLWRFLKGDGRKRKRELELAASEAREKLIEVIGRWNAVCEDERFDRLYQKLDELKERLLEIPRQREARVKALAEQAAQTQLDRFLSLFRIDQAKLPQVSKAEIVMLSSFDIDSADDVLRRGADMQGVISEGASKQLIAWAHACARRFSFDASRGADPDDVREIDQLLGAQQEQLLASLRKGHDELKEISDSIHAERGEAQRAITHARVALQKLEKEMA